MLSPIKFKIAAVLVLIGTASFSAPAEQKECIRIYDNLKTLSQNKIVRWMFPTHPVYYHKSKYTTAELLAFKESIIKKYSFEEGRSEEYKSVERFLRDPDGFVAEMDQRFQDEKAKSGNPYLFKFDDLGKPVLQTNLNQLSSARDLFEGYVKSSPRKRLFKKTEINKIRSFMAELVKEIQDSMENPERMTYLQVMRLTNMTGRMIGFLNENNYLSLDKKQRLTLRYSMFLKLIDRRVQGYRPLKIEQEMALFRRPVHNLKDILNFDKPSNLAHYNEGADRYYADITSVDRLTMLYLPSSLFMERDIFMLSLSRSFSIRGATLDPIFADGFYRPAGDFAVHDDRHIQDITRRYEDYIASMQAKFGVSREKVIAKLDQWTLELLYEINHVAEDAKNQGHPVAQEFKNAVDYLAFNIHHDRGWVASPSGYKAEAITQDSTPLLLYASIYFGGQFEFYGETEFHQPVARLKEARFWLDQFWHTRMIQENFR